MNTWSVDSSNVPLNLFEIFLNIFSNNLKRDNVDKLLRRRMIFDIPLLPLMRRNLMAPGKTERTRAQGDDDEDEINNGRCRQSNDWGDWVTCSLLLI